MVGRERLREVDSNIKYKRDYSIDLLKSIAIIGVIVIHTCSYNYEIASPNWTFSVFWGSVARASVPIFFMCSGALFLLPHRDFSTRKLFSKSLPRIIIAMLVWAMFYKVFHLGVDGSLTIAQLIQGLKEVLLFNQEFHLYYLHIILLFYALVPIIRVFLKNASIRDVRYFLFIWFCLGILFPTVKDYPPFSSVTGIPLQWIMNMAYSSLGYGVLGYYIYYLRPFSKKAVYALAFLAGFAFVFFATWHFSVKNGALYQNFLEGMSVGVCLMAAGSFGFCSLLRFKDGKGIFQYVSGASFCMYLIHVFVIGFFTYIGLTISLFPEFFSIPVVVLANGLIGIGVYAVISRIPVINRWLI